MAQRTPLSPILYMMLCIWVIVYLAAQVTGLEEKQWNANGTTGRCIHFDRVSIALSLWKTEFNWIRSWNRRTSARTPLMLLNVVPADRVSSSVSFSLSLSHTLSIAENSIRALHTAPKMQWWWWVSSRIEGDEGSTCACVQHRALSKFKKI